MLFMNRGHSKNHEYKLKCMRLIFSWMCHGDRAMRCRTNQLLWKLTVALVGGLCLIILSCSKEQPLKIGFVGGLTGRVADLGVAGRDAAILAIDEKNHSGGINGRKLELIIKDDRQDAESAKQAVRELILEQVAAIIGPMTSSMAVVMQPLIDSARIVTISPTVKTNQLSALDDYFLRVTTPLSKNSRQIAAYAVQRKNLKKFAVVYDVSNRAFTDTWLNYFTQELVVYGGQIVDAEEFTSQPDIHFLPIAKRVIQANPDAILLLSSAIDTALLAQQIRKLGSHIPLFSSEWAFTTDLISFGGHAVDGMTSVHSFNANSREPRYLSFKDKFVTRFGYEPSFASVLAYDATIFLFAGLARNSDPNSLKETLLQIGAFPGLQSTISIDRFGDVERQLFLTVVADDHFKVIE
jgi:branched-chain amino acid transport system substrate-binding protein